MLPSADCHVMTLKGIFRDYATVVSDHSIVPTDGSLCGCVKEGVTGVFVVIYYMQLRYVGGKVLATFSSHHR